MDNTTFQMEVLQRLATIETIIKNQDYKGVKELSDKAILTYNQHFVRINKSRAGDKATKAKGIISDLFKKNEFIK